MCVCTQNPNKRCKGLINKRNKGPNKSAADGCLPQTLPNVRRVWQTLPSLWQTSLWQSWQTSLQHTSFRQSNLADCAADSAKSVKL